MEEDPPARGSGQERILRAAIEVIAERGFKAAATSEIARRAGVAEGTIFRHFKTKELLLAHIVEPMLEHVIAPLATREFARLIAADYPSFREFLRTLARDRLKLARQEVAVIKIVLQEVMVRPELRALVEKHMVGRVLPPMLAAIVRFQERGEVRRAPPASVVRMMFGSLATYVILRHVIAPERDWDDDAEVELIVDVLARGLAPA